MPMRLLKLVLISAIAFSLLILAISLLIPSQIRISRAVDINSQKTRVLPYVQNLEKWPEWNLYAKENAGKYEIRVLISTDSLIRAEWRAGHSHFQSGMALIETRPGTITVQWYFDFDIPWYPWEKIASIVYDRQMGPVMDESLAKLKQLVESNP
jgi:hypothetical protein